MRRLNAEPGRPKASVAEPSAKTRRARWLGIVVTCCAVAAIASRLLVEVTRISRAPDDSAALELVVAVSIAAVATVAFTAGLVYVLALPGLRLSRRMRAQAPLLRRAIVRKDKQTTHALTVLGIHNSRQVLKGLYLGAVFSEDGLTIWGNSPTSVILGRVPFEHLVSVRDGKPTRVTPVAAYLTAGKVVEENSIEIGVQNGETVVPLPLGPMKWRLSAQVELSKDERMELLRYLSELWNMKVGEVGS